VIQSKIEDDLHQNKLVGYDETKRTLVSAFPNLAWVRRTGPSLVDQDINCRGWTGDYPSSCRFLRDDRRLYSHNDWGYRVWRYTRTGYI
jgi:hypothetical protein